LTLKPVELFINDHDHDIFNEDINFLITKTSHDVVYLDPPYNERQYSANYHVLETIAKYDNPEIR
jgi:adenine-specific DNA-methyltransferase